MIDVMGEIEIKSVESLNWIFYDMPTLKIDGVHIYRISLVEDGYRIREFQALLSLDEQIQANRYLKKQDQDRFTISKAALRIILSRYMDIAPKALRFDVDTGKKPFVKSNRTFFFNISHSSDWALIAVSNMEVGIDIEFVKPDFVARDIVQEYFSQDEISYLNSQHTATAFFKLWTRKEAFLKATGQGIGDHLKFTPSLTGVHQLNADLYGYQHNWKVLGFMLNSDYACAVATASDRVFFLDYRM